MRRAAAALTPGFGALVDNGDFGVAFLACQWSSGCNLIVAEERFEENLDRVEVAGVAQEIRFGVFVTHDAAGDRRDPVFFAMDIE